MVHWSVKKNVKVIDLFTELIFVLQSHCSLQREFGCRESLSSTGMCMTVIGYRFDL
jgi:hypothetical protein